MWPHVIQKMTSCARVHNWNQVMYTYMGVLIDASTTKCVNISNTKLPSANRWRLHVPNNTGPTHLIQKTRYTRFQNTTHQDAAYYFRTNGDTFEQVRPLQVCVQMSLHNERRMESVTHKIHTFNEQNVQEITHVISCLRSAHTHTYYSAHWYSHCMTPVAELQTKRIPELWNLRRWRKSLSQILHAMGKNQDLLKANFHQQFISIA